MTVSDYTLNHPELGSIVGLARDDDVVQVRGIPFASVPGRFRQSILRDGPLPSQPFNARQPGPECPQLVLPFPSYWTAPPPSGYPTLEKPIHDEFNCLNLSITAPRKILESGQNVPVLVFIHGGAFMGGSQSIQLSGREIYDATDLVRASLAREQPVVVVTINYRVGLLGFLTSDKLAERSRAHGEAVGNYGLHDQRQALEWISRFIAGFGGASDCITIHGTSAGGASCHYQVNFPNRKFQSAILSSGTSVGIASRPMPWHQERFDYVLSQLPGLQADDSLLDSLVNLPLDELLPASPPSLYSPLVDGEWVPEAGLKPTLEKLGKADEPLPNLMIGATEYERDLTLMLLSDLSKPLPHPPLPEAQILPIAREVLAGSAMTPQLNSDDSPFCVSEVAQAYNLTREKSCLDSFEDLAGLMADVAFRTPPIYSAAVIKKHQIAHGHSSHVLLYEIQATNPYKNWSPGYKRANHGINDIFLFNPAEDQVPAEHLENWVSTVGQIRAAWLDFCYGKMPWAPFEWSENIDSLGGIYVFPDGGEGRLCKTLDEVDGTATATRWRALLKTSLECI
ncbi:triacylglycerol lipase V precursor [Fusarium tjaetaba]|uniref:Carboxylic ester hydrolase n=1 Tax=Fusarium tjaetaba TaxID=1567544 RepID=A0A8H5VQT0_9HYPO|nr:triacylglycerol lipase V precursor [Fusarium tjaetaba]KAF5631098.1 triacylglycerol lipase V precursor [Fusarium tjaetaba]